LLNWPDGLWICLDGKSVQAYNPQQSNISLPLHVIAKLSSVFCVYYKFSLIQ